MMSNKLTEADFNGEYNVLADDICARTGKRNISVWCFSLEKIFNLSPRTLLPHHITKEHIARIDGFGVNFTFSHPHAIYDKTGDVSRWFLHEIEFIFEVNRNAWPYESPFFLDVFNESQDTIMSKLGDNFTEKRMSDNIQSFYLDDGRIIGVQWNDNIVGIRKVIVTHLGGEEDYNALP